MPRPIRTSEPDARIDCSGRRRPSTPCRSPSTQQIRRGRDRPGRIGERRDEWVRAHRVVRRHRPSRLTAVLGVRRRRRPSTRIEARARPRTGARLHRGFEAAGRGTHPARGVIHALVHQRLLRTGAVGISRERPPGSTGLRDRLGPRRARIVRRAVAVAVGQRRAGTGGQRTARAAQERRLVGVGLVQVPRRRLDPSGSDRAGDRRRLMAAWR